MLFKATKSTIITKLPRILIIHLKRFKIMKKSKLSHPIKFPLTNLSLQPYTKNIKKALKYSAFGMILHLGN